MTAPPSEENNSGTSAPSEQDDNFFVVGIGASAGGIGALQTFFDHVPDDSKMAFVVIQHLDPEYESDLSAILQRHTGIPAEQVSDRTHLEPGRLYVIPPGKSLSIEDGELRLADPELPRWERAPVDLFFRSLAESEDGRAVGIVLSGTGSGGSAGLRSIHEAGGFTLVQDPGDAEYPSMPRHAEATGVADAVLPVAKLPGRLVELRRVAPRIQLPQRPDALSEDEQDTLDAIIEELREQTGNDFSNYKQPTMLRRVNRRMQINNTGTLEKYLRRLKQTGGESDALFQELLVSVTQFFRNPRAFATLDEQVISALFEERDLDTPIRAWVPGCATGEEAYSIGMLLIETSLERGQPYELQIFATDIDEDAIKAGRKALYSSSIEGDVSSERLQHFFSEESGGYRVRRRLREQVIFASHNLLTDPPFSNLDLLSCRNLLIYLDREMQSRILDLFHYALRPGGLLFLGSSESVEQAADLFSPVHKSHGIYRRKDVTTNRHEVVPTIPPHQPDLAEPSLVDTTEEETSGYEKLHRSLLENYAPPSLLVNAQHELVHVTEGGQRFLEYPAGAPTQNALQVVRSELRADLRTALFQVFRAEEEESVEETRRVQLEIEGAPTQVNLRVHRIDDTGAGVLAIVIFEEREREKATTTYPDDEEVEKIEQLERELEQTKKQLSQTIEQYETKTEDLRASNEELQSMNEELQSTAEELETSKEELQSVNEELRTVNQELQDKNEKLARVNSDLRNLMASTDIGVIFLDRALNLRRYTPPAQELFNFMRSDEGRPLSDLRGKMDYGDEVSLVKDAERVLDTLQATEREVQKEDGKWYLVRILPYRTQEDKIDGIVITFVDITGRKETELELREREEELRDLTERLEGKVRQRTQEMRDREEDLRDLNEMLEEKVRQRTQEIRELGSELTLAEQNERDRISQVLHDELQQELHAVQMWASALDDDNLSDDQNELLGNMRETLDASLERTQTLAAELSPPPLDSPAFEDVLRWLALHVQDTYGMDVELALEDACRISEVDMRTLLFRLVRELLFNVVKHAEADRVRLRSRRREDGHHVVEVIDDGKGFDPETLDQEGGFGLYSVRNRLDMFDGHLELESAPGEGTHATIFLPPDRVEDS